MSNDTNEKCFDNNFSKLDTNYWINANAGSGKTFNLVQRFVFLLQNGISVDKILCITYTEAAATEMKKRVIKKIDELIQNGFDAKNILKNVNISKLNISTIHSFCRQLLSQQQGYKPLSLLSSDEKTKKKIRNKIYDKISKNREIADDIKILSKDKNNIARFKIDIIDKIIANQNKLLELFESQQNHVIPDFIKQYGNQNFEQKKSQLEQKLKTIGTEKLFKLVDALKTEKPDNIYNLEDWRFVVFTTKFEEQKLKKNAEIDTELQNLQNELILLFKIEENLNVLKTTKAFLSISRAVLEEYKKIKIQDAVETYDDMLYGTLQLAKQGKLPHYDYIMLDEAQDTNPMSWKILQLFQGAKFFIVGDQKQSIYGFQGSNIKKYQENYELLKNKAENFEEINLQISFRSVKEILDLADFLCKKKQDIFNENVKHFVCDENKNLSGSVDIIDIGDNFDFQKEQKNRDESWLEIQNKNIKNHNKDQQKAIFLAQKIKEIATKNEGTTALIVPKQTSSSGLIYDILDEINSNFDDKNNDLKIKIKSTSILLKHLLFKDLMAFVNFVILQNDNLNLACLLKSPFFKFTDEEILNLSENLKNQTLWETICTTKQNKKNEFAVKILNEFASFSILNEIGEKLKIIAPSEYADFIDIFEELCNTFCETHSNYELHEFGDFVKDAENGYKKDDEDIKIKKDERFIFSTVHGVKGLEFDNVILLNLETRNSVKAENMQFFEDDGQESFVYAKNNAILDEKMQAVFEEQKQSEIDEKWRLLYVAITRAKRNFYYITDNLQNDKIQYNSFFNDFKASQDFKQNNCK